MNKKLLDDSLESDIVSELLEKDKLSISKSFKDITLANSQYHGKLGVLTEVLKGTEIFLYNEESLLNKYPNGVITEDLIYLPRDKYLENLSFLREKGNQKPEEIPSLLITSLVNYVDNITQSNFTEEEKATIASKALGKETLKIVSEEPEYVKSEDFINFLRKEKFNEISINFIAQNKVNSNYINNALVESKEINDVENPLYKLKEKLSIQPLELLDEKITRTQFEELAEKNSLEPLLYLYLKEEITQFVKNHPNDLATDAINPLIEKIFFLPAKTSSVLINDLAHDIDLSQVNRKPKEIEEVALQITNTKSQYFSESDRDELIESFSLFNNNSYDIEMKTSIGKRADIFRSLVNNQESKPSRRLPIDAEGDSEEFKKALKNIFEINDRKIDNNKMKM